MYRRCLTRFKPYFNRLGFQLAKAGFLYLLSPQVDRIQLPPPPRHPQLEFLFSVEINRLLRRHNRILAAHRALFMTVAHLCAIFPVFEGETRSGCKLGVSALPFLLCQVDHPIHVHFVRDPHLFLAYAPVQLPQYSLETTGICTNLPYKLLKFLFNSIETSKHLQQGPILFPLTSQRILHIIASIILIEPYFAFSLLIEPDHLASQPEISPPASQQPSHLQNLFQHVKLLARIQVDHQLINSEQYFLAQNTYPSLRPHQLQHLNTVYLNNSAGVAKTPLESLQILLVIEDVDKVEVL